VRSRRTATVDGRQVIGDQLDDLLAGGFFTGGLVAGLAAGIAAGVMAVRRGADAASKVGVGSAVLVSLVAAGGAYACTPDTELARLLLGAVVGGGAAAIATGLSWWRPSWLVTGALLVVAALDGAPRASAVVGTVAIAVLHAAGQLRLRAGTHPVAVVAVLAVAVALCSRVAGLADTAEAALLVAVPTVLVAGGILHAPRFLAPWSSRPSPTR
jgi:hypothetical protein